MTRRLASDEPMRGRYLVSKLGAAAYLAASDLISRGSAVRSDENGGTIGRLLLCVGGHLGDALLSTALLPQIQSSLPDAEISVLSSSWNRPVFEGHPRVKRVHAFDHWKGNRLPLGRVAKLRRSISMRATAVREIRSQSYDAAIDVYPYYPNMTSVIGQSGIPVRLGFESGGGYHALTRAVPWDNGNEHIVRKQLRLVQLLVGGDGVGAAYDLAPISQHDRRSVIERLLPGAKESPYIVLHPGSGDPRKRWPSSHWMSLTRALGNVRVVITGAGAAEESLARQIRVSSQNAVDLTGRTTLRELRIVLGGASAVVAIDSAAGHLAAAEDVPVISLMSSDAHTERWKPLGRRGITLQMPVDAETVHHRVAELTRGARFA